MEYREIGNTGLKASEIALGCEGLNERTDEFTSEIFNIALKNGVNCMDLYSPNPDLQRRVGNEIADCREKFILQAHLCTVWQEGQYKATRDLDEVKFSFESMLKNLNTGYVDIGMIHYVDSEKTWKEIIDSGIMEYAVEQKKLGRIKHIGLSSHNPIAALEAVNSGLIEVLMFSVNPCYDLLPGDENCETLWAEDSYSKPLFNLDPLREKLYETCQAKGVGITVMKVFGGGDLLSEYSPAGKAMTANQCIHYALTRPAVSTVMVGVRSVEELEAALNYEEASAEEKDYTKVFSEFPKISWSGHCMYCGHCAPCPQGIDVAMVTKFLNLSKAQGEVPETVRQHYSVLDAAAGECIQCHTCESRCPFEVKIVNNIAEAKEMFGF